MVKEWSKYLEAAVESTEKGIDHFLLRHRAQERGHAVQEFDTAVEKLMREALLQRGSENHSAGSFWKLVNALQSYEVSLNTEFLSDLHEARNASQHRAEIIDPEPFYALVKRGAFPFLVSFYEDTLGRDLPELFEGHYLTILKYEDLPRAEELEILSIAALRIIHRDLETGVEFAQRALDQALRLWGGAVGVDDPGLSLADYIERWKVYYELHSDADELEPDDYPHYCLEYLRDHNCDNYFFFDAQLPKLFRSYQSFKDLREAEEYIHLMRSVTGYVLEEVSMQGGGRTKLEDLVI